MSALGDVIYVISILFPAFGLISKNYLINLMGTFLGVLGFLVFVQGYTDIAFSGSTFYLAIFPLLLGLVNLAYFFNWLREERI
ncbi:ORF C82 [Sulfolobus spindle-shaped virus Lassen]|nr:ORF C82 [Sulfolobus spindle-shaped virus Lassen]